MSQGGVPYLDLSEEFAGLEAEWLQAIRDTGPTGRWILGPNVNAFEEEVADYIGVPHVVSVANGTDALVLSLRALGIGPGDEVITSPYTFFATAEAISMVGATPVFADIDADSFNLDPDSVAEKITARTKAMLPVHIFGHPARMDALHALADEHGLKLVEDAAQAFGAQFDGKTVGGLGDTGCFSFYPTKVLGCYGDGGLISTRDKELVDRLHVLRNHGASAPFMHSDLGYNSRLDEIQAALLRIKLRTIDDSISWRRAIADQYRQHFTASHVSCPIEPDNIRHAYNLFTVRVPVRDAVRARLTDANIGSSLCYPLPLHLQDVYKDLGYKPGDLPVAEHASTEALSLPIFPDMKSEQVKRVCEVVLG